MSREPFVLREVPVSRFPISPFWITWLPVCPVRTLAIRFKVLFPSKIKAGSRHSFSVLRVSSPLSALPWDCPWPAQSPPARTVAHLEHSSCPSWKPPLPSAGGRKTTRCLSTCGGPALFEPGRLALACLLDMPSYSTSVACGLCGNSHSPQALIPFTPQPLSGRCAAPPGCRVLTCWPHCPLLEFLPIQLSWPHLSNNPHLCHTHTRAPFPILSGCGGPLLPS